MEGIKKPMVEIKIKPMVIIKTAIYKNIDLLFSIVINGNICLTTNSIHTSFKYQYKGNDDFGCFVILLPR